MVVLDLAYDDIEQVRRNFQSVRRGSCFAFGILGLNHLAKV